MDPYVVLSPTCGGPGVHGIWVQPMGDGLHGLCSTGLDVGPPTGYEIESCNLIGSRLCLFLFHHFV